MRGDHADVVVAVGVVDVADDVVPLAPREVQVDVGRVAAARVEESLEVEALGHRVHVGHEEAVGHEAGGARAPSDVGDTLVPREARDVLHHEEVPREAQAHDDLQLPLQAFDVGHGNIANAPGQPRVGERPEFARLRLSAPHRRAGQEPVAQGQGDVARGRQFACRVQGPRVPRESPARLLGTEEVIRGRGLGTQVFGRAQDAVYGVARGLREVRRRCREEGQPQPVRGGARVAIGLGLAREAREEAALPHSPKDHGARFLERIEQRRVRSHQRHVPAFRGRRRFCHSVKSVRLQVPAGDQVAKTGVTFVGLRKNKKGSGKREAGSRPNRTTDALSPPCSLLPAPVPGNLRTQNRFEPNALCSFEEPHRGVEAVPVTEPRRGVAPLGAGAHELFRGHGSGVEREGGPVEQGNEGHAEPLGQAGQA